MSYLVLARKYRPADFSTVSGQEHVTRTLGNAIRRERIGHAYLFAGPRGVGKTSISRIFAKALNCEKGPTPKPCLKCVNCNEIALGRSLAVREIDGASHNSVENVRDLIDSFRALPPPGSRYKIYIIDEVHMLSTAAFNALLKSLEEPPPHTVFILATTEAHKIPETVISRCQRHDFRALSPGTIEERLKTIVRDEKIEAEPEALRMIARLSDGSMRDAQSLLERVNSFCDGKITAAETSQVLGTVKREVLFDISRAVFSRNSAEALRVLDEAFACGLDSALFLKEFVTHWRELLIAKFGGVEGLRKMGVVESELSELQQHVESISGRDVQDLVQLAREGADSALRSVYPKYSSEALLVRMATRESVEDIKVLLEKVKGGVLGGGESKSKVIQSAVIARAPERAPQQSIKDTKIDSDILDWTAFVKNINGEGTRIVVEHLKRLSVDRFLPGVLEAHGPEFSVLSLEEEQNRRKLMQILSDYRGSDTWKVVLRKGEAGSGKPEAGSIVHAEHRQHSQAQKERKETLSNHPKIKSLQKAFPGSTIENIKIKE